MSGPPHKPTPEEIEAEAAKRLEIERRLLAAHIEEKFAEWHGKSRNKPQANSVYRAHRW